MITTNTIRQMLAAKIEPLVARARGTVRRAVLRVLDKKPDAGLARGQFELTKDEVVDNIELIHPIGVSSRPAAGAEALVFAVGGNPNNLVALSWVRAQRMSDDDLAQGEIALYIGNGGQKVHLLNDGSIEITAKAPNGGAVVLKANGDIVVVPGAGGQLYLGEDGAAKKVALADDVDARLATIAARFDTHVHPGVLAGPGSTAVTVSLVGPLAPTGADNVRAKG